MFLDNYSVCCFLGGNLSRKITNNADFGSPFSEADLHTLLKQLALVSMDIGCAAIRICYVYCFSMGHEVVKVCMLAVSLLHSGREYMF